MLRENGRMVTDKLLMLCAYVLVKLYSSVVWESFLFPRLCTTLYDDLFLT